MSLEGFWVFVTILIFSLDPEQVISETQDSLTGQDQLRFKESILDGIKEVPLSMKEKLRIRRSVDGARENYCKLSFATMNKGVVFVVLYLLMMVQTSKPTVCLKNYR